MEFLTLGDIQLGGFEVPAAVKFGGEQRIAVHKLLGGGRVIDSMGRDDAALTWSGILAGIGASDRARCLDAMRVSGGPVVLSWDVFSYTTIISRLDMEFHGPWWISYSIECTVLADLSQSAIAAAPTIGDVVIADINAVANYVDVTPVLDMVSADGALLPGASAVGPAISALTGLGNNIAAGINRAESGLAGEDLPSVVTAAGELAVLCNARGFIGRSLINLQEVAE